MIIMCGTYKDISLIKGYPGEIVDYVAGILTMLDTEYGEYRNIEEDDGGFVLLLNKVEDFEMLRNEHDFDVFEIIPEYTELIKCKNGSVFSNTLVILNNEFSVTFIMPLNITLQNMLEE